MENVSANVNEQSRTRSSSPSIRDETQRENGERLNMLQKEMSSQRAIMEKILEQSSERVRQVDTAPTTFSVSVQSSNNQ